MKAFVVAEFVRPMGFCWVARGVCEGGTGTLPFPSTSAEIRSRWKMRGGARRPKRETTTRSEGEDNRTSFGVLLLLLLLFVFLDEGEDDDAAAASSLVVLVFLLPTPHIIVSTISSNIIGLGEVLG